MSEKIQFKPTSQAIDATITHGNYIRHFDRAAQPFDLTSGQEETERLLFRSHVDLEIVNVADVVISEPAAIPTADLTPKKK